MRTFTKKSVLTTGQVAKICHVAPRTVSKWFDSGQLRGYRIPGSRDRRIPMDQLLDFMREHGIPLDTLDGGVCRVLLVDRDTAAVDEVLQATAESGHYEVRAAENDFEAGVMAQEFRPHVIVLAVNGDDARAIEACRKIKSTSSLQSAKVVATVQALTQDRREALTSQGFDTCLATPCSADALLRAIEDATDLIT